MSASDSFAKILLAAFDLPEDERAMLAEHMLDSLTPSNQKEIDAAWAAEVERRLREIDEGKVQLIDGETVMAEIRSRRGR